MRNFTCHRVIKSLAFVGLTALGAASANAGLTAVHAAGASTELNHAQILSQTYGGTFAANGASFSNGSITAQRLDDGGFGVGSTMSLNASTNTHIVSSTPSADQCWSDGVFSARAIARFAGASQVFGIVEGDTGGSFESLFPVNGWGTNVTGSISNLDLTGKEFRFARDGDSNGTFTSSDADNFLGADQMVSYHLTGPHGMNKYVLFFEDVGANLDSDWDFNDMVIEISAQSGAHAVPLPPAVWSGLAVLLTGGLWSARVRVRNWFK